VVNWAHETPKLTAEQCEAINRSGGPLAVEDETNHRVCFLIDASTLEGLRRQQDLEAVREGIADMEAGRAAPLEEVMSRIGSTLGLPPA
jgi:predicted transcriptional regulator